MKDWRHVAAFVIVLAVLAGGFYMIVQITEDQLRDAAYDAAVQQRDASVAACTRGRADREDSITGWGEAKQAREATAKNPEVNTQERLSAAAAAAVYSEVIKSFESRLVVCTDAFPPVKRG